MKILLNYVWRVLAVATTSLIIMELIGRLIYGGPEAVIVFAGIEFWGQKFIYQLLVVLALVYPVTHSRWSGWKLLGAVMVAYLGIGVFLTMIEAIVFLTQTKDDIFHGFANGIAQAVVLAGLMVLFFKGNFASLRESDLERRPFSVSAWVRRLLGCSLCYVVLYLVAGFLIFSHVSEFYATQDAPFTEAMIASETAAESGSPEDLQEMPFNPALFFPFQLFRGACYILSIVPLLWSLQVGRWPAALAMAFLFPMIAGVASLIVPNDFMPTGVRHIHMIEIGWSNFVYGFLVGFIFSRYKKHSAEARDNGLAGSEVTA